MKRYLVLTTVLVLGYSAKGIERIGLKDALKKGMVSVSAHANGNGYHDKSLHMAVTNRTDKAIQVVVDPAMIFRPDDTSMQDLVLAGTDLLVLNAKKTVELDEQVFCGKSHASAPGRNMNFTFLKQGDSTMIKVIGFINRYKLYDGLGQDAIWALTNRRELNGVYDPGRHEVSIELQHFMSRLTGWKVPDYYKQYTLRESSSGPIAEQKALKMLALFDWKLEAPRKLSLAVYNGQGKVIQPIVDKEFVRGGHRTRVEFEAQGIAAGMYYIRLMDNTTVMKEVAVKVD